jgi:hypothetical protein
VGGRFTPAPKARTDQDMRPVAVEFKSCSNSIINKTRAVPKPPMTHVPNAVKMTMGANASVFFQEGQLSGSFMSSEGCGISTMSVLRLSLN